MIFFFFTQTFIVSINVKSILRDCISEDEKIIMVIYEEKKKDIVVETRLRQKDG